MKKLKERENLLKVKGANSYQHVMIWSIICLNLFLNFYSKITLGKKKFFMSCF